MMAQQYYRRRCYGVRNFKEIFGGSAPAIINYFRSNPVGITDV